MRQVLFTATNASGSADIWLLPLDAGSEPRPLLHSPFNERNGQFSPDGRWIAYQLEEPRQIGIYVIPFRQGTVIGGGKQRISIAVGSLPRWSANSRRLSYVGPERELMAVDYTVNGDTLDVGPTSKLFGPLFTGRGYLYDVSANAQRVLAVIPPDAPEFIEVVQNWTAALKQQQASPDAGHGRLPPRVATYGYDADMHAGIRELRDNLSRYIRRIESERIVITSHARAVAELVPPVFGCGGPHSSD